MSNAVTAEPDSTSSATDAAAIKQEETSAATSEQREENAADSGEMEERDEKPTTKIEGGQEAEAEAKDPPQDKGTAAEPEQPAALADCSDGASAEAKPAAPTEKASPLQEKIIRQVEFYFGDRNFPKDKFLQQTVESSTDGWVPLTTLLTFNRLKALSSDAEFIASALSKATNGIIEVSEDGKSIRRHPDKEVPDIFDPEYRKEMNDRTVYAKGFPEDTQLDQIQEFIDKYGKVHLIHMRRLKDRKFKGSVFVEFGSVGDAKKFLTSEKIQFNGTDLLVEWKADYFKRKEEERKQKKEEQRKASSGKEGGEEEKDGSKEERKSVVRVSGCILHFSGVGSGKPRDDLKNELLPFGTVAFVDFPHGKTEGYVRFREEDGAKRAREGLLGKAVGDAGVAQLCGCDVELRVLEGEEEEQYWHKVLDGNGGKDRSGGGGRRGGRGGRGGRGRGRGRGWGNNRKRRERPSGAEGDSHPPESKTQKTAED